jgi:hypothetical protein
MSIIKGNKKTTMIVVVFVAFGYVPC